MYGLHEYACLAIFFGKVHHSADSRFKTVRSMYKSAVAHRCITNVTDRVRIGHIYSDLNIYKYLFHEASVIEPIKTIVS